MERWKKAGWVVTGIVYAGLFAGIGTGGALYVVGDPNACFPIVYDPNRIPYAVEPNEAWGRLLAPIPGDPNTWEVQAGKWERPAALACDPEGDLFEVEFIGGTSGATAFLNREEGTWRFTAEVLPGTVNVWRFRAVDLPQYAEPKEAFYWVTCWGVPRANMGPVLW